jgi:hypothetical protein
MYWKLGGQSTQPRQNQQKMPYHVPSRAPRRFCSTSHALSNPYHAPTHAATRLHAPKLICLASCASHTRSQPAVAPVCASHRIAACRSILLLLCAPHWIAALGSYSPFDGLTHTRSCPLTMLTSSYALAHTRSKPKSAKLARIIVYLHAPNLKPSGGFEKKKRKKREKNNMWIASCASQVWCANLTTAQVRHTHFFP